MFNGTEERFGPKLNMFVCFASGEDSAFPVSGLARHSRRTCGWQSPKLCEYPQELGFRFEGEVDLQSFRILVHESKIPSRVEVFVAEATEEERMAAAPSVPYERAVFRRLGHVVFGTNEENNFESRELKTVTIRRNCLYLKLILRKPHTNPINVFGQVGIVAVSTHGQVMRPFPSFLNGGGGGKNFAFVGEQEDVALEDMVADARDADDAEDSPQDIPEGCEGLDTQTIRQVRELLNHKNRAVAAEDYDLAKALKAQVEVLKSSGARIATLEAEKKQAVEAEDYDRAKALKIEIDQLRAQAQSGSQHAAPQAQPQQHHQPYHQQQHQQHVAYSAVQPPHAEAVPQPWSEPSPVRHDSIAQPAVDYSTGPVQRNGSAAAQYPPTASSYDERPAMAGNAQADIDDLVAEGATGGIVTKAPVAPSSASGVQPSSGNGMPDWEERLNRIIIRVADDQPRAEVLTGPKAQESKSLQQYVGSYAAACLFSKRFQLREAVVKALVSKEGFALLPNQHGAAEALVQYAALKGYGVNDAVAAVFFAIADFLSAILTKSLRGAPPPSALSTSFNTLLPDLLLKAGDNNARVREVASTVLTQIASSDLGPERVANSALAEPENATKKPLSHRIHLARVHIVSLLLQEVGLNRKEVRTGLTPDAIMTRLVLPAMQHAHQDVREGALALLVDLFRMSPGIHKHFTDLKPAQRALIEERLGQTPAQTSPRRKGSAQVSRQDEPEMVSSSFSVDKGGSNAVLKAAREVRDAKNKPVAKPAGKAPAAKPSAPAEPEEHVCQFCGRFDKRFNEQSFQAHYLRTCPMLCPCPLCGQVTEISYLQNHIVSECEHSALVRQCPLCKEAVRAEDLDSHVAARECILASNNYSVCPLCHEKLTPAGEVGWKNHLLKAPGCINNPRRFDGGAGEEFAK